MIIDTKIINKKNIMKCENNEEKILNLFENYIVKNIRFDVENINISKKLLTIMNYIDSEKYNDLKLYLYTNNYKKIMNTFNINEKYFYSCFKDFFVRLLTCGDSLLIIKLIESNIIDIYLIIDVELENISIINTFK